MSSTQTSTLWRGTDCEVRTDDLTRMLYATDASLYQITPAAVAFPKTAAEAAGAMRVAADRGMSVIPRGAGTGLAGGAVGDGLVIDFARYNRRIWDLDLEACTVRVGAGVVLDQLNGYLGRQKYCFGPDVATSSRATLGGMIANNSSGAHVPVYGTTVDHLVSLEVILADGTIATVGKDDGALPEQREAADKLVRQYAAVIRERMPADLQKRWPGYAFDEYLRDPGHMAKLLCGSEGTLAGIMSAKLAILPAPRKKGIAVYFFASVLEAMRATVEFLDLNPVAVEHIDRPLFDQTKGQMLFKKARSLMRLDEEPCESILIVEFYDDCDDKLAAIEKRNVGLRRLICKDPKEQELVWQVRKQGLSLLTACKGEAKPAPGIEDVCVRPEQLPDYVTGLMKITEPMGLQMSFYGHAASGELHVRPKVNMHDAGDIAKYRKLTDAVAALCKEFKGSLAAEHGVGIARTEYLPDQLGPDLMEANRALKKVFDPKNLLNPGKIISDGRFRIDQNLRLGAGYKLELPFTPMLGYVERDGSFVGNLEQCNGCGGCRKDAATMCPTYIVTNEEIMSTRGRANTLRAAFEGRVGGGDGLFSAELDEALSNCLSCKACKTECPSNVDIAQLKADVNHAKHERAGIPLIDRMVANADLLGRLNCGPQAGLINAILRMRPTRKLLQWALGFTPHRPLPPYASQRFDKWFAKRRNGHTATRGKVILFDDTWVRYNEPNIGQAAVKVLESAGFEVVLPEGRKCCGRPAMSRGVLHEVRRLGGHNLELFMSRYPDAPIVFLEPSCHSMFIDDYRNLKLAHADRVAPRCVSFEEFVYQLLLKEPGALKFRGQGGKVAIHGHCHAKALTDTKLMPALAEMIPSSQANYLSTACCGMAGAFGMLDKKYELSVQVAQPLVDQIKGLPPGTKLVASGTSCRHQIGHLTEAHPLHMAELLAEAL